MHASDLEYELPEALIAQEPLGRRDAARLLCVTRDRPGIEHHTVADLPRLLSRSLIVLNDTRVIPARHFGHKPSGGKVEILLIERLGGPAAEESWLALGRASKGLAPGQGFALGDASLDAQVVARRASGELELRLALQPGVTGTVTAQVRAHGTLPLPPYIRRAVKAADAERYQTVYAAHEGAVAAPTAGLHFTRSLLEALTQAGHPLAYVTLHVGPGTFAPLRVDDLDAHPMHAERFEIPEATGAAIAQARAQGREVLAVGTTVVRALEAAADGLGGVVCGPGRTDLFIRPPYAFRVVDGLLTNFHLPRSTLLALVMAFGGVEPIRDAYRAAVAAQYRFFSYGDAMWIRNPRS